MSRKLPILVAATAFLQIAIAIGIYHLVIRVDQARWPVFAGLIPDLVFSDVGIYHDYATEMLFWGKLPYRDLPIEYPPLAPVIFCAPWLFSVNSSQYIGVFAALMLVLHAFLIWAVARRVADVEGLGAVPSRLAWMTAAFVGVALFVIGRFDTVPALLSFVAAAQIYGNRPERGGFLAAIGALIKIVPGVVLLPALASILCDRSRRRWGATLSFAATMAIGVAAWFWIGGAGTVHAIRYHSERGIEVGSLTAGILSLVGKLAGAPVEAAFDFTSKSQNVYWEPWSTYAAKVGLIVQALLLAIVAYRYVRSGCRDPFRFAGAAILAFAIGGKVFSPQYLLWVLPFVTAMTGRRAGFGRGLFLIASLLTMVLYPWAFRALGSLETWTVLVLNLRNLVLLWLLGVMVATPERKPAEVEVEVEASGRDVEQVADEIPHPPPPLPRSPVRRPWAFGRRLWAG